MVNIITYVIIYVDRKEVKLMLKGNKLRLYPNQEQRQALACMFGNQRFVWNQMLGMLNDRFENGRLQ